MKKFVALFFLFSWVFGYTTQIRFPLIALDLASGLLLVTNWKTLFSVIPHTPARQRGGTRNLYRSLIGSGMTSRFPTRLAEVPAKRVRSGMSVRRSVFGLLGILLLSWFLSLRMFSMSDALPGLLYLLRTSMYVTIMFFAKELFTSVTHWIPVALWVFIGLGISQYLFLPDTRFLMHSGWDEHYYRMIGTVLDPNYLGVMLGVVGIFGLFEFERRKAKSMLLLSLASFTSLVLTFSRASWLATAAGLLILVVKSFKAQKVGPYKVRPFPARWGHALIGVSIAIIVYAAAPKPGGEGVRLSRSVSVFERLVSWQNAVKIWQYQPLVGVGFNNYKAATLRYGLLTDPSSHAANAPSSSWLLLGATLGVLGVLGVLGAWIKAMRSLAQDPLWSAIAVLVGVHAAFNNTLFYVPMLALLAILKGTSNLPTASR